MLHSSPELRAKVKASRAQLNINSFKRYAPKGTPPARLFEKWALGFLEENRRDWEDACRQLTGDPKAVPFIWEDILARLKEEEGKNV